MINVPYPAGRNSLRRGGNILLLQEFMINYLTNQINMIPPYFTRRMHASRSTRKPESRGHLAQLGAAQQPEILPLFLESSGHFFQFDAQSYPLKVPSDYARAYLSDRNLRCAAEGYSPAATCSGTKSHNFTAKKLSEITYYLLRGTLQTCSSVVHNNAAQILKENGIENILFLSAGISQLKGFLKQKRRRGRGAFLLGNYGRMRDCSCFSHPLHPEDPVDRLDLLTHLGFLLTIRGFCD